MGTPIPSRVGKIKGQLDAIQRWCLPDGRIDPTKIPEAMHILGSVRGALRGLGEEIIEAHIRQNVLLAESPAERDAAIDDLMVTLSGFAK